MMKRATFCRVVFIFSVLGIFPLPHGSSLADEPMDLVAKGMTVDDSTITLPKLYRNYEYVVNVGVLNDSDRQVESFDIIFSQSQEFSPAIRRTLSDLMPGEMGRRGFSVKYEEAGEYLMSFVVDPDNAVAESNEDNNRSELTVEVWEPPYDLGAGELVCRRNGQAVEEAKVGEEVSLELEVINHSDAELRDVCVSFLVLPDDEYSTEEVFLESLPPKGSAIARLTRIFESVGKREIGSHIDPHNRFPDNNPGNDKERKIELEVSPGECDLEMTDISIQANGTAVEKILPGEECVISLSARNNSDYEAPGAVSLRAQAEGRGFQRAVEHVRARSSFGTVFNYAFNDVGEATVSAWVRLRDYQTDPDESNNSMSKTITVLPPDFDLIARNVLVVGRDGTEAGRIMPGVEYGIRLEAEQSGESEHPRVWYRLLANGVLVEEGAWNVNPCQSAVIVRHRFLVPGIWTLRFELDSLEQVPETDETNNALETAIEVRLFEQIEPGREGLVTDAGGEFLGSGDLADGTFDLTTLEANPLEADDLWVEKRGERVEEIAAGEQCVINLLSKNRTLRHLDDVPHRLEIGSDVLEGRSDIPARQYNRRGSLLRNYVFREAGTVRVRGIVDPEGRIPDRDREDNSREITIRVTQGDRVDGDAVKKIRL